MWKPGVTENTPEQIDDLPGLFVRITKTDLQIKADDAVHKREEQTKDAELRRRRENREHWVIIGHQVIRLILAIALLITDLIVILWVANSQMTAESKQWLLLFLGGIMGTVITYLFGGKEKEFKLPDSKS